MAVGMTFGSCVEHNYFSSRSSSIVNESNLFHATFHSHEAFFVFKVIDLVDKASAFDLPENDSGDMTIADFRKDVREWHTTRPEFRRRRCIDAPRIRVPVHARHAGFLG